MLGRSRYKNQWQDYIRRKQRRRELPVLIPHETRRKEREKGRDYRLGKAWKKRKTPRKIEKGGTPKENKKEFLVVCNR